MSGKRTRGRPTDVASYAYASCQTCNWKLSREGDEASTEDVCERGAEHALTEGHLVTITATSAYEFDYRVERGS